MTGKLLGQYKIIPNKKDTHIVWDVVDGLGNIVCWSFDSPFEAYKHIQIILKLEKN
tara:strand:- start:1052 stop:1219 length:168 start_codon:yes stop_codon:yes gene_type:complete